MVERPIKKSERQIAPPSEAGEETQEIQETQPQAIEDNLEATTASPEKRKVIPSIPGKEKSKARGKGSQREEGAAIPPMNMALMRGPKPTKPKPPVVTTSSEEIDSSSETESELEVTPQE